MIIKVYVQQLNPDGSVKHEEFVRGHTVKSEAEITAANMKRSIRQCGNDETHFVVVREEP
jgi:hypothetical protein